MPRTNSDEPEIDQRPKALRYAAVARTVEEILLDALPEIATKLATMAKEGNVAATRYVMDRLLGRPARLPLAPTADPSLPYDHIDWTHDLIRKQERRTIFSRHATVDVNGQPSIVRRQ